MASISTRWKPEKIKTKISHGVADLHAQVWFLSMASLSALSAGRHS
jgi:hypothetical protein